MELDLNEFYMLKDGEILIQKIQKVISILQEKGFKTNFSPSSILYTDNTLNFNLHVSFPVESKAIPASNKKRAKTFLQSFKEQINNKARK